MCGIAGVFYADKSRTVDPSLLKDMAGRISHRGPDGEGFWARPGIALAHRRLSIIDLEGGQQPIGNEDGSVQVVLNGEIYNFGELRNSLEKKGHVFRTRTDTEVLVHLYEERAERLVEDLRGMFAFAIWDSRKRRLLLARDRVGIKPLYFYRDAEKLIFGSELKAILAYLQHGLQVDAAALEDYLAFGVVCGSRSIFRGVEKLPPAHTLQMTSDSLMCLPQRYWQLRARPNDRYSIDEWQEAIRAEINESIRLHLISDVPVGAFLSGGVDSSVVVASAAQYVTEPIQTFSIGFEERNFSELPYARIVSQQYGTKHTEHIVRPDAAGLVDELSRYYDEPFADSSAIPTYLVAKLASNHVKVVLSGDGGDEAFGGYGRYAHDLWEAGVRNRIPSWIRRSVLPSLAAVWPKADWLPRPLRAKTFLTNLTLDPGRAYANSLSWCRPMLRRRLLAAGLTANLNGHDPAQLIRHAHDRDNSADALARMIAADMDQILPDDYLVKVDRASMACGLEVRPPLLDHHLLEVAATIPSAYKIRRGEPKWIFKRAYGAQLPAEILWRPKQGFAIPVDNWLRGPLRDMFQSSVLDMHAPISHLIDQDVARKIYRSHLRGTGRHGNILWSLLVLARWASRYEHRSA